MNPDYESSVADYLYLDNKEWWEPIISGEYTKYYEKMYGDR